MLVWVIAMKLPKIVLEIASISRTKCHSFDEKGKTMLRVRIVNARIATFEATERKATTGVGESESGRRLLVPPSHSKPCMILLFHTAPK